jgi:hypothetical protein
MNPIILIVGVLLLWVWITDRWLDKRKAIVGCVHRHGKVSHARTNRWDDNKAEWLNWHCDDCPFQTPLHELRALPGYNRFWYSGGLLPTENPKEYDAGYQAAWLQTTDACGCSDRMPYVKVDSEYQSEPKPLP